MRQDKATVPSTFLFPLALAFVPPPWDLWRTRVPRNEWLITELVSVLAETKGSCVGVVGGRDSPLGACVAGGEIASDLGPSISTFVAGASQSFRLIRSFTEQRLKQNRFRRLVVVNLSIEP